MTDMEKDQGMKQESISETADLSLNASSSEKNRWEWFHSWWENATKNGWRAALQRYAYHAAFLALLALGAWIGHLSGATLKADAAAGPTQQPETAVATPGAEEAVTLADLPAYEPKLPGMASLTRIIDLHTDMSTRQRLDIIKYQVQQGDSVFGIAEKFDLKPETILWGNNAVLKDNPHALKPGQELNILPVDGTLHEWSEGETLTGVADYFDVSTEAIIDWPGNDLDMDIDLQNPDIQAGVSLVVPGGHRELVSWTGGQISRSNPAVAKILGPGACPAVYDGPIGTGVFIYPTVCHYLSGFDYDPVVHPAVDFAGAEGAPIYASDSGVVVYAGWNNWGYGNVIVLDHGNGWQTLYAHMAYIPSNIYCGLGVYQGAVIGPLGNTGNSTGPHLHFEMRNELYGKVNPWNFLP